MPLRFQEILLQRLKLLNLDWTPMSALAPSVALSRQSTQPMQQLMI